MPQLGFLVERVGHDTNIENINIFTVSSEHSATDVDRDYPIFMLTIALRGRPGKVVTSHWSTSRHHKRMGIWRPLPGQSLIFF